MLVQEQGVSVLKDQKGKQQTTGRRSGRAGLGVDRGHTRLYILSNNAQRPVEVASTWPKGGCKTRAHTWPCLH
jgi:hypothetical protein